MHKKKLMVLGASLYQLDAIRAALGLGLQVVTLDNRPENPGHALAHKSYNVDTTDAEAVLTAASREKINGIIAPATDVALPTAAWVAQAMALPGVDFTAATTLCHKRAFRKLQKKLNLPRPRVIEAAEFSRLAEVFAAAHSWIIKPTRSSGSKGIFIVDTPAQFLDCRAQSRAFSLDDEIVLEEYIPGFQGTLEGVLENHKVKSAFFLDRQTAAPPYVATHGHRLPTALPGGRQSEIIAQLEKIFHHLDIREGPFDADFVVSADSECCYIIEMAPRLGGNSISRLIALAADFDLVDYSIKTALGLVTKLPPVSVLKPTAVSLLGVTEEGLLNYDQDFAAKLKTCPWVFDLTFEVPPLTPVKAFINGQHRVGQLFVQAPTRELLEARVHQVLSGLRLQGRTSSWSG